MENGMQKEMLSQEAHLRSTNSYLNLSNLKQVSWSNYEKVRVVGKGAFGTAVLYRKRNDDSFVVIKEINMHDLTAAERNSAINEAKVLSMLNHPNIVTYFDSFECDGKLLIEMEYCDGGTLAAFLQQLSESLKEIEILLIFQQIVSAISYLHDEKILHRDLKTANIFMTKEMIVKVGDFGISKMLNTHKAGASTVIGTPYYISPEMCEGKSYNEKADIWALGCILYEMASLQKTFEGTNLPALINKIVKGQFAPVKRKFSSGFRQLINDLLQIQPELRPHAYEVQEYVYELVSKTKLDPFMELMSGEFTTRAVLSTESKKLNQTPRSILYEVNIGESHVSLTQVPFPKRERIKSFVKSSNHYVILTHDMLVYSWGCAVSGQLGLGSVGTEIVSKPTCIEAIRGKNIVKVCVGEGFSIFMTVKGLVMSCGDGSTSCLGHSDSGICHIPKLIDTLINVDVCDIACDAHHAMAVTSLGYVYGWGCNVDGRLGIGHTSNLFIKTPTLVTFPNWVCVKRVFCGPNSTMFLDSEGCLWACGYNKFNKLGVRGKRVLCDKNFENYYIPVKLKWLQEPIHSVAISVDNSALLFESGKVMILGNNEEGQLGLGHVKPMSKPSFVTHLKDQDIMEVKCGTTFTLASTFEDDVYFWGGRYISQSCDEFSRQNSEISTPFELSSTPEISETIKIGDSNSPLMQIVEEIGPDHPVLQIRDPKVIVNCVKDLKLLNSPKKFYKRDIILTPQPIISLYSSQVHLQFGETVSLGNIFCFSDDRIFIVIETTIPVEIEKPKLPKKISKNTMLSVVCEESSDTFDFSQTKSSEAVPNWIIQEAAACDDRPLIRSHSYPPLLDVNFRKVIEDFGKLKEMFEETKQKLEECQRLNRVYERQIEELQQQNSRLRRRETPKPSVPCVIQ